MPDLKRADCVVVVAGWDAALASVVGGLVAAPVIAVPTSTGYGAAFGGVSALLAMLDSCAAGRRGGEHRRRVRCGDDRGADREAVGAVILYVDCIGGVAGDMLLGALLDAGRDGGSGGLSTWSRARHGRAPRDHRRRPRRSRGAGRSSRTATGRRSAQLIAPRACPSRAEHRAQEAFKRLAIAEGRIHDIDAGAGALPRGRRDRRHRRGRAAWRSRSKSLDVERVICSPLPMGRGFVEAAHGRLPLPAPATLELLKGAPIHGVEVELELVTPTGAALVAALAECFGPLPRMTLPAPATAPARATCRRSRTSSARSSAPRRPTGTV